MELLATRALRFNKARATEKFHYFYEYYNYTTQRVYITNYFYIRKYISVFPMTLYTKSDAIGWTIFVYGIILSIHSLHYDSRRGSKISKILRTYFMDGP